MPLDLVIETVQAMHAMQLSMSSSTSTVEMPTTASDTDTHQAMFSPVPSVASLGQCIDTYA